jgi:hypothetical protein
MSRSATVPRYASRFSDESAAKSVAVQAFLRVRFGADVARCVWLRGEVCVGACKARRGAAPYTPHPAPRTPHPAPRTPHPAPRTPHPAPHHPNPTPTPGTHAIFLPPEPWMATAHAAKALPSGGTSFALCPPGT